ncbi:orotidine-5'-phosphate decarboxylase [Truepera radiovictrix]|nr:orotidine-5'-phosphate decarboxylase [Truepera radiovictrix]WMT57488.1 orotidine-5'-phosphate decarboxylase [Truepera radiovictrix]
MTFFERLAARIQETDSRVCLGIDPRPEAHPLTHPDRFAGDPAQVAKAAVYYFQAILEATAPLVACAKLQAAFFEVLGIPGLIAMAQLIADLKARGVPVIVDAKRGDIGSTAEAYARAYLGDGVFGADALTVNPYLGGDGLAPFAEQAARAGRGVFVLVRTSNPRAAELQDLELRGGQRLYERVAESVAALAEGCRGGARYAPVGAVVGGTAPEALAALRARLPHVWFLVPGYGAQGGRPEGVAGAFDAEGLGAVVSSSRALTYCSDGADFAERAREAAAEMRRAINRALGGR